MAAEDEMEKSDEEKEASLLSPWDIAIADFEEGTLPTRVSFGFRTRLWLIGPGRPGGVRQVCSDRRGLPCTVEYPKSIRASLW